MGGLVRRVNDRRVWTGVVLVVLGVITSVVVATAAAAMLGQVNPRPGEVIHPVAAASPVPGAAWTGVHRTALARVRWLYRLEAAALPGERLHPPRWARPAYEANIDHQGFGWPMVCLTGWRDWGADPRHSFVVVQGWSPSSGEVWLPATPAWGGLAADTAFWAAAWWLLLAAPRKVRRWRRARRGECVRCGYDLRGGGGGGVCPECGWERKREGRRGDTG